MESFKKGGSYIGFVILNTLIGFPLIMVFKAMDVVLCHCLLSIEQDLPNDCWVLD
jgi:hypothetical protein